MASERPSMPLPEFWARQPVQDLFTFFMTFNDFSEETKWQITQDIIGVSARFEFILDENPPRDLPDEQNPWLWLHRQCCALQNTLNRGVGYRPNHREDISRFTLVDSSERFITICFGKCDALKLDYTVLPGTSPVNFELGNSTADTFVALVHAQLQLRVRFVEYLINDFPEMSVANSVMSAALRFQRVLDSTQNRVRNVETEGRGIRVYAQQQHISIPYGNGNDVYHLQMPGPNEEDSEEDDDMYHGVSLATLAALPRQTIDDNFQARYGERDCPICLDETEQGHIVISLPCGHYYHQNCLKVWFMGHNTCPACRASVSDID